VLHDEVFGVPSVAGVETALAIAPISESSLTPAALKAQRIAAFEDAASRIPIPISLGAGGVAESRIIITINLTPAVKNLMSQLDELDMVREWPSGGDDLLWRVHTVIHVHAALMSTSRCLQDPEVEEPVLAMQVVTLRFGLRSLLQQRQAARERNNVAEIVEIEESELIFASSTIPSGAALPALALGRSVSDASSTGTPGGSTPMSARGSVVGPFANVNSVKVARGKSPLGDVRCQGSSAVSTATAAGRIGLNIAAAAAVVDPTRDITVPTEPSEYRRVVTGVPPPPPPPRRVTAAASKADVVVNSKPFKWNPAAKEYVFREGSRTRWLTKTKL
jgi:hypothetical protein